MIVSIDTSNAEARTMAQSRLSGIWPRRIRLDVEEEHLPRRATARVDVFAITSCLSNHAVSTRVAGFCFGGKSLTTPCYCVCPGFKHPVTQMPIEKRRL